MPSKKKSKNKPSKMKTGTAKKTARSRKDKVKARSRKKSAKKKSAQLKTATSRSTRQKRASVNSVREIEREISGKKLNRIEAARRQSDFQGLSRKEEADAESIAELVEEGNLFEASAVAGVEEADSEDEREVHTHEVPEDDVPDEYLEKE
jgi:N utilization substance protein A